MGGGGGVGVWVFSFPVLKKWLVCFGVLKNGWFGLVSLRTAGLVWFSENGEMTLIWKWQTAAVRLY